MFLSLDTSPLMLTQFLPLKILFTYCKKYVTRFLERSERPINYVMLDVSKLSSTTSIAVMSQRDKKLV